MGTIELHFNASERAQSLKNYLGLPKWEGQDLSEFVDKEINGARLSAWEQYNLALNIDNCIYASNKGDCEMMEAYYSWIEYAFLKFGLENPKP